MAITVRTQILGQDASSVCSYCYLYEPLVVSVGESDLTASFMYVDIEIIDTSNSLVLVETLVKYGEFDINSGELISVDLMKLARQHHDAELFKFSHIDDIIASGWTSVVSKYKYRFKIYTDKTTTPIEVFKLPIIGGRLFKDFSPTVTQSNPLTEAEVAGVSLEDRWCDYGIISSSLSDPTLVDSRPSISEIVVSDNEFYVGIDETESSTVAIDDTEQIDFIGQ